MVVTFKARQEGLDELGLELVELGLSLVDGLAHQPGPDADQLGVTSGLWKKDQSLNNEPDSPKCHNRPSSGSIPATTISFKANWVF